MTARVRNARLARSRRVVARGLVAAACLAAVAIAGPRGVRPANAQTRSAAGEADPCSITTTERIVAVGDVHGAHARFVAILRAAGLIDQRDRWSGGRAILVQTGDVLDRGPDSRKTLDLLRRLERDADQAGGHVYALLGNHEVMRMIRDWRYVSAGEYAAFRTAESNDLRERVYEAALENAQQAARNEKRRFDTGAFRTQFLKDVPTGALEMRQAFSAEGDYGRWLRTHVAAVTINGVVFVHGGVSPTSAALGCRGINAAVAKDVSAPSPSLAEGLEMFSSQEDGPLWYRGLVTEPEAFAPQLQTILTALGARAIVVGHTVTTTFRVATRFGGQVIQIDTGMLGGDMYKGGQPVALEIVGNSFAAIYLDRREPVPGPSTAPAVAP